MLDSLKAGIVLIDKPQGWTSHDVVAKVRRLTGVKRVGHAGTLDPLATGLLIVLVGREFTQRQAEFMKQEKEYLVTGQLGLTTDSYDSEGLVVQQETWQKVSQIERQQVVDALDQFRGEIAQQVPAFSAVKVKGKKLYEAARRGKTVQAELPVRRVTIKEVELVDFAMDETTQQATFSLRVVCSSGTYIRSLIHDLGQVLGVGATVTALRRTRIGDLHIKDATPLA